MAVLPAVIPVFTYAELKAEQNNAEKFIDWRSQAMQRIAVVAAVILCYCISGLMFGYEGWSMPVFTVFRIAGGVMDDIFEHGVPQWRYLLMQSGLIRYSAMTVAFLALVRHEFRLDERQIFI